MTVPKKNKTTFKILKTILIFIFVSSVILLISLNFLIKTAINSTYVNTKITQLILEKTGAKINPGKITLGLFPEPYVRIKNIQLKHDIHIYTPAQKKQKYRIRIKIKIGELTFYPDLTTVISAEKKGIKGTCVIKKLYAYNSLQNRLPVIKNIKSFSLDYLKTHFTCNSKKIILKASVTGIHPSLTLNKGKTKKISGRKITAEIDIKPDKIHISLGRLALDYPEMNISMDFLHEKQHKKVLLEFTGQKVCIDEIKKVAFALLKDNEISNEIFDIVRAGQVNDLIVSFKSNNLSTLFNEKNMLIKGEIEKGRIKIPETPLVTDDTTGHAVVEQGILYTDIKQGRIKKSFFKNARLKVDLINKKHPFKGTFPINADIKDLALVLKKLLPRTRLERELNLCHDIKGNATGILVLDKMKNKNHLCISVKAGKIQLQAKYDRIPGKIRINKGNFTYEGGVLIGVAHMNGSIGTNKFSDLKASVSLKDRHLIRIKSGKAVIVAETIFPWLISFGKIRSNLAPLKSISGKIDIDSINLHGPVTNPDQWQYKISGACKNIAAGTKKASNDEIKNLSMVFRISDKTKYFTNITGEMNKTELLSRLIKTKFINDISMPLSVYGAKLYINNNQTAFKGNFLFKTGPDIFLEMKIPAENQKAAPVSNRIKGCTTGHRANRTANHRAADYATSHTANRPLKNLLESSIELRIKDKALSNAVILYDIKSGSSHRHLDIKGQLNTKTITKLLKPGTETAEKFLRLTNNKDFIIVSKKNDAGLIVSTDILDLSTFYNRIQTNEKINPNGILSSVIFPVNFDLKADKLTFKTITLTHFQASITMNRNLYTVFIDNAKLCNMNITGIIDKSYKINLSFGLCAEKGDLAEFMKCLLNKKGLIKGEYSIRADLNSTGDVYQLMNGLHGKINFLSSNGRIYKLTLLSRILSVINISGLFHGKIPDIAQNGFAYNSMTVKANVRQGRIIFKSAVIKGVDMTFIFKGWIDILKHTLQLTCLVSPFKTADMIIKHVPLLDHIMNNRLISFPLKITGNIDDPDVTLLPPSEVGKGLMDMMQRIMTTPFRIIKSIPRG